MLIMAEVTVEMAEELKASALAKDTSVATEVGRRLEWLARLEAEVDEALRTNGLGGTHPSFHRSADMRHAAKYKADVLCDLFRRRSKDDESLYSGSPNPWDMFRNTGNGR